MNPRPVAVPTTSTPAVAPVAAPAPTQPTKFQRFAMARLSRAQIQGAPYNPRVIDNEAKKRLRDNLRRVGLVAPITVNKRNMRIVGGHQRIAALDALEGSTNYQLDVALVDLDDKAEQEQVLFLNNEGAQGQWDLAGLEAILKSGVDIEHTGFDLVELETLFGDQVNFFEHFSAENTPEVVREAARELEEARQAGLAAEKARADAAARAAAGLPPDSTMTADALAQKARMKTERETSDDPETYAVVMFMSRREREDFMEAVGVSRDDRYVSGERVIAWAARAPGGTE